MTAPQRRHAEFCRRGHDLREPGSYYERSDGGRNCRTCRLASQGAWRAANPDFKAGTRTKGILPAETRAKISAALQTRYADPAERERARLAAKRAHAAKGGAAK